jgi:hypothetical protein
VRRDYLLKDGKTRKLVMGQMRNGYEVRFNLDACLKEMQTHRATLNSSVLHNLD